MQAVLYEKPGFEGSCMEVDGEIFSFCESEGDVPADLDTMKLKSVSSLKIIGGLWVFFCMSLCLYGMELNGTLTLEQSLF